MGCREGCHFTGDGGWTARLCKTRPGAEAYWRLLDMEALLDWETMAIVRDRQGVMVREL